MFTSADHTITRRTVPGILYDYAGVLHVHSTLSDGSGTVAEIIQDAQDAALDFLVLTDHEHLQARDYGYEGWHDRLLLLVGEEITPRFHNHYLAFDIRERIRGRGNKNPQEFMDAVAEQGGLGFIAHPIGEGYPTRAMACPWTDWDVTGFTGIEIWSYMHDWAQGLTWGSLALALGRPDSMISGPPRKALETWDAFGKHRRVVGLGTLDIHAKKVPGLIYPKILPYPFAFRTIRTHLLLSKPLAQDMTAASQIYEALEQGHGFMAHDGFADSTGFQFTGQHRGMVCALMGDEIPFLSGLNLHTSVPELAHISLLRDGNVIVETDDKRLSYPVTLPGVYRVEVRHKFRPWIFSNAIYVRPS